MKGKIYVLLALTVDTGDNTLKEAIIEEIAAGAVSPIHDNAALHIHSDYFVVEDAEIIEVGSSLEEIRK